MQVLCPCEKKKKTKEDEEFTETVSVSHVRETRREDNFINSLLQLSVHDFISHHINLLNTSASESLDWKNQEHICSLTIDQ